MTPYRNDTFVSQEAAWLLLPGLDGTNPLAYLAALGLFRVVSAVVRKRGGQEPVRMSWVGAEGTWVPRLSSSNVERCYILDLLEKELMNDISEHPAALVRLLGSADGEERRTGIEMRVRGTNASSRDDADWISAIASDTVASDATSQLQAVRRDYYHGNLETVMRETTLSHLERSLFRTWDYADPLKNQSLHWDPSEDRRHAHQWNKPAGDPRRNTSGGMLGANRLAIEALPLFTSLPVGESLRTVGFTGDKSNNTRWTWPIWSCPVDLATARSVMTMRQLQEEAPSRVAIAGLRAAGIVAAYRSRRILVGKTPNFTPSEQIA